MKERNTNCDPQAELLKAIDIAGSQVKLADLINQHASKSLPMVRQQHIHWWAFKSKKISAKYAVVCERALKGRVSASRLRPDIFDDQPSTTNHSPQREASDAGTVGSGHRTEALATGDLQPNKTSRGTPPESQGQPSVSGMRRRRRLPSSTSSSPCGGGSSTPSDAGVKP